MDYPIWEFTVISICIVFSFIFSGSETALTALSETKTRQIMEERGKHANSLQLWLSKPNSILTTILIGNNLVNIAASAIATDIANKHFQEWGISIAVGGMTFLILIFGEILPKTFAKQNAERISIHVIKLMHIFYYLFSPISVGMVKVTKGLMKVSGMDTKHGPFITEEDIEFLIDLGAKEGVIEKDEEEMLQSIFEFGDILVKEIMVPRTEMLALPSNADLSECLDGILNAGHTRIPVFENQLDNIIGILYSKDLLQFLSSSSNPHDQFKLDKVTKAPFYVPESKKISALLKEFKKRKQHMAIAVDEFGGTAGLVTLEDIIEEIVGEIHDEFDEEEENLQNLENGNVSADAKTPIREFEDYFDIEVPSDGDYESLGGFITTIDGKVPQAGTNVSWDKFNFKILEADEKKILRIEIQKIDPELEKTEQTG